MKISVVLPCYEMHGFGARFLEHALLTIQQQTHPAIEVVIGDQSNDRSIEELCGRWSHRLDLRRISTIASRGSPSANLNAAMEAATGDVVKILFQDDLLADRRALERVAAAFHAVPEKHWLVCGFEHSADGLIGYRPFVPVMQPRLSYGVNTFGPPSTLSIRRTRYQPFDPKLAWMMDVEAYSRMMAQLGEPLIEPYIAVTNREWSRQNTHELPSQRKLVEELASLRPRALNNSRLPSAAIHRGQEAIASGLADALLSEVLASQQSHWGTVALDQLTELRPIDRYAFVAKLQRSGRATDPEWEHAASILASYHTSEAAEIGLLQQIGKADPSNKRSGLVGLIAYLHEAQLNPTFPTRWLLPVNTEHPYSGTLQPITNRILRYAQLAGCRTALGLGQNSRLALLDSLLTRAQSIATLFGLGAVPKLYLGRLPYYAPLPTLTRSGEQDIEGSGIAVAIAGDERELRRQALMARTNLASGGFLIQVDLGGDPIIVKARTQKVRRPFLVVEQIFS